MDLTDTETAQLAATFNALNVKPKCDTPADLEEWMLEYLKSAGKVPTDPAPAVSDQIPAQ